ncbi:MAG: hypothetical protein M3X11_02580, partial [Acidobacteriota bacterium]|nr:hypothetical protein [Acidobacteriota bacterium]
SAQKRITVLQCGMGAPAFAERLSEHLRHYRYDMLLVAGLAGGLDRRLKSGDAVIYDICRDGRKFKLDSKEKPLNRDENASIHCNDLLVAALSALLQAAGQRCFRGSGVTVDRVLTEAQDKQLLGDCYQAAAADMESYDVLSICSKSGLPAAVLRVISDDVGSNLPNFNWAAEASGRMNPWRMGAVMVARPAASLKFLLGIRSVINALRENLKIVLQT